MDYHQNSHGHVKDISYKASQAFVAIRKPCHHHIQFKVFFPPNYGLHVF